MKISELTVGQVWRVGVGVVLSLAALAGANATLKGCAGDVVAFRDEAPTKAEFDALKAKVDSLVTQDMLDDQMFRFHRGLQPDPAHGRDGDE